MSKEATKLSNRIKVLSDFQFSINIEYDLLDDIKIKNYIPTAGAIDIIEDVMLSTSPSATDRARIFIGPYGKGKSHLALMLLALLCKKDKALYSDLLSMICETKPELCRFISDYQDSNQKFLPVVIQGSSIGIRQSFLLALRKSLQQNKLEKIMPNTYFSAAICAINTWKKEYPATYESFKSLISCSTSEFISELGQYNSDYYDAFLKIYPQLTSGSEFNPLDGLNIVELYNDVNSKIRAFGYTGIFVVFDEFSKFLTGNLKKTSSDEIEQLQNFAENCCRSGEKQMHIMLISHQSILNYVDKLSKAKVDSWKAVSGRYKSIELNTSSSQTYELISRVVRKDEKWFHSFENDLNSQAKFEMLKQWRNSRAFEDLTSKEFDCVVRGCYPLHPITTFLLPRISEKIAQNERTIFTFLSAESQQHTLPDFLSSTNDSGFPLLTPDVIFDYFEPLFKADGYDRLTHKSWKTATVALSKLKPEQVFEAKIVKTIALLNILDRADILAPTVDIIISIFSVASSSDSVISALTALTDAGVVRKLDNRNCLRVAEHTEQNVDTLINDAVEKIALTKSIDIILNDYAGDRVLYPNAYNDDHEIVRYFRFRFISAKEIINGFQYDEKLAECDGDGIAYAVVSSEEELAVVQQSISNIAEPRIVFIIPKESTEIVRYAYKHEAIHSIMLQTEDNVLIEELRYSLSDVTEALNDFLDEYLRPELGKSLYYFEGQPENIHRKSALSRKLTDICERVYRFCPTINNEVINKNILTGQAINSRAKVVDALLANDLLPNLGLIGSGQDVSFMRSTLRMTGILKEQGDEQAPVIRVAGLNDNNLEHVLTEIKNFIVSSSEGKKTFTELYDRLTAPENHIGMKKGAIPIYLAVVLRSYKRYAVIIKNKREIELNARVLESINNAPQDYELFLEQWDAQKEKYIDSLEQIFELFIRPMEKEYGNFSYIVKAMQRWHLQLPKYVKEIKNKYIGNGKTQSADIYTTRFLNSLRAPEINAREFLFSKLLWVFEETEASDILIEKIKECKAMIDETKAELIDSLAGDLKKIFNKRQMNEEATLPSIVTDWTSTLNKEVFSHVFSNNENTMLSICTTCSPDEGKLISDLARPATGLRIDDWGEITVDGFIQAIKEFVKTVNAYNDHLKHSSEESTIGGYKLTFFDKNGTEKYKTFNKANLSKAAQLLYNDVEAMLQEEYGASLTDDEKRQVLFDIIEKVLS